MNDAGRKSLPEIWKRIFIFALLNHVEGVRRDYKQVFGIMIQEQCEIYAGKKADSRSKRSTPAG